MRPRTARRALVSMTLIVLAACDQSAKTTQPPLVHDAGLKTAARSALANDRQLLRSVVMDAARDGIKNAKYWFGERKQRTPESVCRGLERLLTKHLAKYDAAKGRQRTPAELTAEAALIVEEIRCGMAAPMSMFGRPLAMMAPLAVPDSMDDWLAENFRQESWSMAVENHALNGGGSISGYTGGMTEFEVANFDAVACAQRDAIADLTVVEAETGGGSGEDPMMMYFMPMWAKMALGGCAGNVIVNVASIVEGAKLGAALFGGPGGAVAGAVLVAAEHCAFGAVAGYVAYKLAQ
jgi:hypothetical protein